MFDELLRHPGVTEESELRSRFGFLAFHGGSLERGTAEIAANAANTRESVGDADPMIHIPTKREEPVAHLPACAPRSR